MAGDVRVGLVGCGRLAERGWIPALRRAPDARLAAVAEPDRLRRERIAPGVPAYEDAAAAFAAAELDAVVIATPAASHLHDAAAASAEGLPALVEKPPAVDSGEASGLAQLDPPPWIGFNRRFEPRLVRLREQIPEDRALELELVLHHPAGAWGSYVVRDDALLAIGSHLIDLARWLTGSEIERVRALELEPRRAIVELELGRARARISCSNDSAGLDRVKVRHAGGRTLRYTGGRMPRRVWRRLRRPGRVDALVHLLRLELEDLVAVTRGGAPRLLASAGDGLAVMSAIDATRRSAEADGSWSRTERGAGPR